MRRRLNVQPPSQNLPQRGDVSRAVRGVCSGPAGQSRRAGEVAEAVAAPGRRSELGTGGSGEGGTGAGILHWRLEENEGRDEKGRDGERASLDCTHGVTTVIGSRLRALDHNVTTVTNLCFHSPDRFFFQQHIVLL